MTFTLAPRLFLSYLLVVIVALATAAIALSGLLQSFETDVTRARAEELAAPFVTAVQRGLRTGVAGRVIVDQLAEQAKAAEARLIIIDPQRRIAVDSENRLTVGDRLPLPEPNGLGSFQDGRDEWLFVQETLSPPQLGTIVVAKPRAAYADTLRRLLPPLAAGALAAAVVALAAAGLLAGAISRPLRSLAASARRFAAHDYQARALVGGPPETHQLGTAFNEMVGEIGRARGTEQAFLADISHELRTPLTAIHGFAQAISEREVTGDEVTRAADVIQRESRRLVRLVEALLEVAKLQAGTLPLATEKVDLARVVADTVDALQLQARDAGVTIAFDATSVPAITADPDRIAQVFVNVIDNAVRHAPRDSAVTVGASREEAQGRAWVVVRVRDRGPGLPDGAGERLFARFWRGESSSAGHAGLGLAIAQAIVEAHGGGISAANADGGGAEFTVRLPAG